MNNKVIVMQKKTFVMFLVLCLAILALGLVSLATYQPGQLMSTKYTLFKGCIPENNFQTNHLVYCNPIKLTNGSWMDTTTNPAEKYLN